MPMHKLSFEEFFEDGMEVNTSDSLYIIVDGDKCRRAQHNLHNVPLLIKYNTHTEKVAGQYCMTCHQIQIRRNIFAGLYQEYGEPCCKTILKGFEDVQVEEPQPNYPDYLDVEFKERASESKLCKLGYSVASTSGISDRQRQALLRDAIEIGTVTREYVISYLAHMIKINGQKVSNEYACKKWKADLDFVHKL